MTSPIVSIPNTQSIARVVLENGIVVLVYENFAAQSVVISGSLRAGSLYESPAQNGLAALTASALMRGTSSYDFTAIATALEDIGADLDISAGTHRTGFGGKALAEDLPVLIDLLAEVLRDPAFPPSQVERLRGEVMTGLQIRSQDTRYRARRAFLEALYPDDHPFHYASSGTLETLPAITVDDLHTFHKLHFGPAGMIIAVVGAVHSADAVEIVRSRLADWYNPDQPAEPPLPSVPSLNETRRAFVALAGKTQSDLVMGSYGPSRFEPDYLAATLANCVLGQFGMMGRIGASVREELGLAYYAYSSVDGGMGPSPWSVTAGVNPANLELALDRIVAELRRITSEVVSEEDLDNVQSFFVGRMPLQLESNEGIAAAILNMELYSLGLDYLLTYRDRIMSLTQQDLLRAAQRYLHPDAYVLGISGPNSN
jgi:zinc protease